MGTGYTPDIYVEKDLDTMRKQLVNPPQRYDGKPHGLSHAVIDTATGTVYISGQVDWDMNHQVSSHTVEGQLKNALNNLTIVLDASGSSVENLLNLRIYIRGEFGEFFEDIAPILAQFLADSRPALTGIGVASLASPETLVEIEATAALK
ncbi:RidA family protein [Nostoc sp. FACHB-888]|uniref:RidA family protein n=1 Tax=Nostoc sp. FACHB-888 TaxID=2692842 RepID=UPI001F55416E|nr:RidA family protein [Nostoc sp. FACHB-888]